MEPRSVDPEILALDPVRPDPELLAALAGRLAAGSLVAFPTETVYGLGARIDRPDALDRVFAVKGRPATDPLIVHVTSLDALEGIVGRIPDQLAALADSFWPGPLTVVVERGPLVDDRVTAGGATVAVRVPAHPVASGLIHAVGAGVAAPSANRFGRISPTRADDVLVELGDRLGPGDVIVDGGPTPLGIESTVVDLTGIRPTVLRHGGVTAEDLAEVLGEVDAPERRVVAEDSAAAAPGGLLRHYAPETPLVLVDGDRRRVDELVSALADRSVSARPVDLPEDPAGAAAALYRTLRDADGTAAVMLVAVVSAEGVGRGVNDRLFRASHGRVVGDSSRRTVDRLVGLARA